MDACQVLLGHPWLFDKRVMHNYHLNTYTFSKDHEKISLTPLKATSQSKPQDTPRMDVFLTTLLHSQLHEFEAYKEWILLGQEPIEAKEFSHHLLISLLKAFKHVLSSKVPHALPPKRSIQHKIDVVPSSTLLNKSDYRMNP